ncbi:MAG: leucine-rich repeat domain-containing protein [Bacteroidia bacterium]
MAKKQSKSYPAFKKFLIFLVSTFVMQTKGQNEFDQYGPMGCAVFTDLKEALKSSGKVYKLDLNYVKLEPKYYNKIGKLTDLMALRLRGNEINTYPEGFNKLIYLAYFASYNNDLTKFPDKIGQYFNLEYLEFQHSKIDSIPADIAYLKRLRSFKFGNTDDSLYIPKSFRYLKGIKDLSFENVILDSLPTELFRNEGIKFLYLSNTNTHYLTKHFERMPNLEVLVIENNPISKIPFEIYKAEKLRLISLRNNKITSIPETITELTELSLLDLRGNPIPEQEIEKLKALLPGCNIKF